MPEIAGIGVLTAFLAGIVSFLSPCVLPLVPGYVSYVAGRTVDDLTSEQAHSVQYAVLVRSAAFVLGFSSVFVALGASASAIGSLFQSYRYEAGYAAGAIIIVFGLHMTGLLRLQWMNRDLRPFVNVPGGRPMGAFLLGTAFAFGWTPCIGPILGVILTLSATTMGVSEGAVLLAVYSSGLGIPFLLVAGFTGRFVSNLGKFRRIGGHLQLASGGILILVGILLATGSLFSFGTWMLKTFPVFQDLQL